MTAHHNTARPISRRTALRTAGLAAASAAGLATWAGRGTRTVSATQASTKATLALDWYPNANHAGLYLARERGLFAAAGVELEIYTPSDPTVVLQTVGSGNDTFGISYQTDVLLARAQDVPVVSIAALVQHPLLGIMSLQEGGITRPADLAGKQVGYPGLPSQEAFLATMLETDGASLDDVELVNVGFDLVPATIAGQLAGVMGAYWTHETILAEREGYPVSLLRVEDWGVPDYYELVLTASESTVADRPDLVTAFLSAVAQGYTDAAADPAAALAALISASDEIEPDVEAEGIALLIPADFNATAAFAADLLPPIATPVATPGL